jgi:hypothetical protein
MVPDIDVSEIEETRIGASPMIPRTASAPAQVSRRAPSPSAHQDTQRDGLTSFTLQHGLRHVGNPEFRKCIIATLDS